MPRTAMLTRALRVEVVENEDRPLRRGEVRLAMAGCGVSGTDARTAKLLPANVSKVGFGRGLYGKVIETSRGTERWIGDTVVPMMLESNGMADSVVAKADNCVRVPKGVDKLAVLAEPLACCLMTLSRVNQVPDVATVVFGATGLMGELLGLALEYWRQPSAIIAVGRRKGALERTRTWADDIVLIPKDAPLDHDDEATRRRARQRVLQLIQDKLQEHTGNPQAGVVYEMTGAEGPLVISGDLAVPNGTLGVFGHHHGPDEDGSRTIPLARWAGGRVNLEICHFDDGPGKLSCLSEALILLERDLAGGLEDLLEHYPLAEAEQALRAATLPSDSFLKAIVTP